MHWRHDMMAHGVAAFHVCMFTYVPTYLRTHRLHDWLAFEIADSRATVLHMYVSAAASLDLNLALSPNPCRISASLTTQGLAWFVATSRICLLPFPRPHPIATGVALFRDPVGPRQVATRPACVPSSVRVQLAFVVATQMLPASA